MGITPYKEQQMTLSILTPNPKAWQRKQRELEASGYSYVGFLFDGLAVCHKRIDGKLKYGFLNSRGIEVVPCIYDWASRHVDGFAIVEKNGLYGFVNSKGKKITECEYDELNGFRTLLGESNPIYGVGVKQNKFYIISRTGDALGPITESAMELLRSNINN